MGFLQRPRRAFPPFHAGLVSTCSPQANTESPSALVLLAALTSRSCTAPQAGQVHSRTARERDSSSWPQAEQRLELGYHRLIATSVRVLCGNSIPGSTRFYAASR